VERDFVPHGAGTAAHQRQQRRRLLAVLREPEAMEPVVEDFDPEVADSFATPK
jgi:hypothetical protein